MITFSVNKNIDLFIAIPRNNQNNIPDNMIKLKDKLSVYQIVEKTNQVIYINPNSI